MLILGQKSWILGPTIFKIPQPNIQPYIFFKSNRSDLEDPDCFNSQVQVFPAESSGLTNDIRFQVKPPTENCDSVFDYDNGRDELVFTLIVQSTNDELKIDNKTFTIALEVK